MPMTSRTLAASALLTILAIAGCGGGKSTTTTTTTSATSAPATETQRETAALPLSGVAPVPAGLNCAPAKPVWVNRHTKAYHEEGDPYFGRTKNGEYMCAPAAIAAGYHLAGARHKGMNTSGSDASGNAMQGPEKKHKHHKKNNDNLGASPEPTDTP